MWDFDAGALASAKPLWIKVKETASSHNLLTFSDGSTLRTDARPARGHRFFNAHAGAFTPSMDADATPLGTPTRTLAGGAPTLVSRTEVHGDVDLYNVVTFFHMVRAFREPTGRTSLARLTHPVSIRTFSPTAC